MSKNVPFILFLFLSEEFGEDEQLALEDIEELDSKGIPSHVICYHYSKVFEKVKLYDPDRLVVLNKKPSENFDFELKEILKQQILLGVNVVHVFGSNYLGSVLPWLLRYKEVSVVVTEGPRVKKTIWHLLQSFFYSRIDAIIVPSVTLKKRIQLMRPKLMNKIRVVHPGLNFKVFNSDHYDSKALRKKWGISNDAYLVGMIASPEYVKSQSAFIKAAASFLRNEELANRTKFVIVGFDPENSEELTDLIRLFHLQDQIILVPFEDSIPEVLNTLDVYVLPSSKAMFGLQAMESLSVGTPIICAMGPDAAEWIGNSNAGLLMRSGDSFDLQRKLRLILENPDELKLMGKRAIKFARENYDRQTRTDKLIQLFDKVIRKRDKDKSLKD